MHGIVADCFSCFGCYYGVVIVHLQITTCNRFTYEDVRDQRKHLVTTLKEAFAISGRTADRMGAYCTDGDSRRSKEILLSYYRALRCFDLPLCPVNLPLFLQQGGGVWLSVNCPSCCLCVFPLLTALPCIL